MGDTGRRVGKAMRSLKGSRLSEAKTHAISTPQTGELSFHPHSAGACGHPQEHMSAQTLSSGPDTQQRHKGRTNCLMCLPGASTRPDDHILKFCLPKASHLPLGWGSPKQNRIEAVCVDVELWLRQAWTAKCPTMGVLGSQGETPHALFPPSLLPSSSPVPQGWTQAVQTHYSLKENSTPGEVARQAEGIGVGSGATETRHPVSCVSFIARESCYRARPGHLHLGLDLTGLGRAGPCRWLWPFKRKGSLPRCHYCRRATLCSPVSPTHWLLSHYLWGISSIPVVLKMCEWVPWILPNL